LRFEEVEKMVGNTPHVRVHFPETGSAAFYVKLEGHNPTGSIKDRTCLRLLKEVMESGQLRPGMNVLDASSGNLGCSLAYYSKLLGYEALVVASSKLTAPKRDFIHYYGSKLHLIGDWTIEGNRYCQALASGNPERFCFLDQLHNWSNPAAHYETTGPEILSEFPDIAMVVGSLGSGGSLLGIGRYIKEHRPEAAIVAVQAARGTRLPGTASLEEGDYVTPFIDKGYKEGIFDHTVRIQEMDAVLRTAQLRDQGLFCGLQTGGVMHAALQVAGSRRIKGAIVLVSGDSGWKNMDKLVTLAADSLECAARG
jgi:[CysO sulfur-carrier protein]-thiocarboxylate-dependent cysteine synthase